jgi:hypothetical protein
MNERVYRGESEAEFYGQLSPDDDEPEVDYDDYDPALEEQWFQEEIVNG